MRWPLHFARLPDGTIQLSWNAQNFYLESASDVNGPWEYIASGITSLIITPSEGNQFLRLHENYSPQSTSD